MIEFKTCLVAHIDIMGFKKLLENNTDAKVKLERYFQETREFLMGKSEIYKISAPADNFKSLFVSDSIILSIEIEKTDEDRYLKAGRFFYTIGLLQYMLAVKEQIWTRGAISIGPLCMDVEKNILVGQAFINAYLLEQTADYPRIIIDPRVLSFFRDAFNDFSQKIHESFEDINLIGVHNGIRFDTPPFSNDAILIDWFRHSFIRTDLIQPFFDDLKDRMGIDHNLFSKGSKLIPYLLESYASYAVDARENRNADEIKRAEDIYNKIQHLI
ncbi:hypothetical protein D3C87_301260 [compost metagenome]